MKLADPAYHVTLKDFKEGEVYYYMIKSPKTKTNFFICIEKEEKKLLIHPTYFRLPELYSSSEFLDLNEWHTILNMVREAVEQDPRFRLHIVTGQLKIGMKNIDKRPLPDTIHTFGDVYKWNKDENLLVGMWGFLTLGFWFFWGLCLAVNAKWVGIVSTVLPKWFSLVLLIGACVMTLSLSYRFLDLVTVSYLDWKRIRKEWNT